MHLCNRNQTTAAYSIIQSQVRATPILGLLQLHPVTALILFLQRINPYGPYPGMNGSNFNTSTGTNDNYQGTTCSNLTPGSGYVCLFVLSAIPTRQYMVLYSENF